MSEDRSAGYEANADRYLTARSRIGAGLVRGWAEEALPQGAEIVDLGCGTGVPVSEVLIEDGYRLWAIDASASLLAYYARRFPDVPTACEAAQDSSLFGRQFDGAVAIGLMFLLSPHDQRVLIANVARALRKGGRFLFSAPTQTAEWEDMLTGRTSCSLGIAAYTAALEQEGMRLESCREDRGSNNYYDAVKR